MNAPAWEDPRRVLARHGLFPKRSFSQNFLVSQGAVDSIARAVGGREGQVVIELGPGLGTLTAALLRTGASVVGVERDRDMLRVLGEEFAAFPQARFCAGDAAELSIADLLPDHREPVAVAGNLPYAVTGSILRRLGEQKNRISHAVIMVQREVRDRLVAEAGTREYGALTVFVQAAFDVSTVMTVPPGAFHPPPKVSSSVVLLRTRPIALAEETPAFRAIVKAAFETRRKTLRNAILNSVDDPARVDAALAAASIDGKRRGETLSIAEFRALSEHF